MCSMVIQYFYRLYSIKSYYKIYGCQGIRGEGINWKIGIDIYTVLYIK